MKYPDGRVYSAPSSWKEVTYGNRGMDLEHEINLSNQYYLDTNRAVIYKKPTPIKVSDVDYQSRGKMIRKAFFESPSTTDYNGVYRGKYIDFEAKETILKTSFPLKNIHEHQIQHMFRVLEHGGICFLIVRFQTLQETYLLPAERLQTFLKRETRSSIPYSYFQEYGYRIPDGYVPRIDYLKVIDTIYGGVF